MQPNDPLYAEQWHLTKLGNIEKIWDEFSGAGIHVVVFDSGVELDHPDLAANYDPIRRLVVGGATIDGEPNATSPNAHGTAVAGLIIAAANGEGGVGVAWGSTFTSVDFTNPDGPMLESWENYYSGFHQLTNFDVSNHSWSAFASSAYTSSTNLYGVPPYDIADQYAGINVEYDYASANGRGGLGTIIVQGIANDNIDAQFFGLNVSRFTISVAGTGPDGFTADYSNYGACVLVTAPTAATFPVPDGGGLVTTDLTGDAGYVAGDYTQFGGTSGSGPIVSGVVALMLDANPGLGWRDVQNIIAASARHTGSAIGAVAPGTNENSNWFFNKAANWNGGGMHFSNDYGYGALNAYNAVRMAEVWSLFTPAQTSANEKAWHNLDETDRAIPDGGVLQTSVLLTPSPAIDVEHVELSIDLTHGDYTQLRIYLISPSGTEIQLYDGSGGTSATADGVFNWTYGGEALRGEDASGTWTVRIEDTAAGETGTLLWSKVVVYGSAASASDIYHYTDEFLAMVALSGESGRTTLSDTNGGIDWVNAAAVTGNFVLNLLAGATSRVSGNDWFEIAVGTLIENAVTGDGNDQITGNGAANRLYGMRGNDTLSGGIGADQLFGGAGNDSLFGGTHNDLLTGGAGTDTLRGDAGNDTYALENGSDNIIDTSGIDTITSTISRSLNVAAYLDIDNLTLLGNALTGTGNGLKNIVTGNTRANTLDGGVNADTLKGAAGNDTFRFLSKAHSGIGAKADIVLDFDDSGNDRIDLSRIHGPKMSYIHNKVFTAAGQVRINDVSGADVVVEVNTGGSLAADFSIRLKATALSAMAAGDFTL